MIGKQAYESWTISDEFWGVIEPYIPTYERDPNKTYDNLIICRPTPTECSPQNLCLDAAFAGKEDAIISRNSIPHIRPRGEEKKELEQNPNFKARRWVVEVTHSFLNRFRKLLVRFEKTDNSYLGLIEFAFAIIVWRKLIPVHKGMVIVG